MILKHFFLILIINQSIITKAHLRKKHQRYLKKKLYNTKLLLEKIKENYQNPDKLNDILKFLKKNKDRKLNPFAALGFGDEDNSEHGKANWITLGAAVSIPILTYGIHFIIDIFTVKKLTSQNKQKKTELEKIIALNRENRELLNIEVQKVEGNMEKLMGNIKEKVENLANAEDEEDREELNEKEREERELEFKNELKENSNSLRLI